MDNAYALRTANKKYRTTPLRALWQHAPYFHDGSAKASPSVIGQAIDTASAQGWRRPLLAWLNLQAQRAEQGGDMEAAAKLHRRIALTEGGISSVKESAKENK